MWPFDYFRRKNAPPRVATRAVRGGRASVDSPSLLPSSSWLLVSPSNYESNWSIINLSSKDFDQISPPALMDIMADLSPEVSRALWDYLRLVNPGYEYKVTYPGSDEVDEVATAKLGEFVDLLSDLYGSFDVVIGRMNMGPFLRGAICAELVLDRRGRMPVDLATPDPGSIRFRTRKDAVRGEVWQPGQWQEYDFVPLDMPTFRYIPIDPLPASPYGRPIAAPALFIALFILGIMHDLRRVVQQQGYPRIDIGIDIAQLLEHSPQLGADLDAFNTFVSELVAEVEDEYSALAPDDAYIHTSNIMINKPVGTLDTVSLGGIDGVIAALERMVVRGLKTMPIMMGLNESVGDTQSNRQWEIYIAGIKSIQHYTETTLERLFEIALRVQGIQSDVEFRFAEVRDAERLRDAQAEAMEISNAATKRDQGWISQDEASQEITGGDAVEDEPFRPQSPSPEIVGGSSDGQQLNSMALSQIRQAQLVVEDAIRTVSTNGYHAN